jgi:hypothetical protein
MQRERRTKLQRQAEGGTARPSRLLFFLTVCAAFDGPLVECALTDYVLADRESYLAGVCACGLAGRGVKCQRPGEAD